MNAKFNPYDELGVPNDADEAAVKSAYRRKAQSAHPDKGGTQEGFQRVAKAYALLSDPEKRSRYDKTGNTDDTTESAEKQARDILCQIFILLVDECPDVTRFDIFTEMRARLRAVRKTMEANLATERMRTRRYEKTLKRVRHTGDGQDFISQALRLHIKGCEQSRAAIQESLDLNELSMNLLKVYEYEVASDAPNPFIASRFVT